MPFNGSGVYTAPAADFPVVTQTVISSTHFNNTINDIATALSTCLTKDGQQTATANIPFGGFRATNVGITGIAGSVGTPAINVSDTGTGLYRSAASELAVTVAGTQRARFDSTGLIVTGAASVSTTLTAITSVVTGRLVINSAADASDIQPRITIYSDPSNWAYLSYGASTLVAFVVGKTGANNTLRVGTTSANDGTGTFTTGGVQAAFIDSGTTGSLSLKTNNGSLGLEIAHTANSVNLGYVRGSATGVGTVEVGASGASGDTNVSLLLGTKGTGSVNIFTGSAPTTVQGQFLHTASSTRWLTFTGSNGGNPTLSTTAGSLAITPAVVIAGASLSVDTSTAVALSGTLRFPSTGSVQARNANNTGDVSMIQMQTINSSTDIVVIGSGSTGLVAVARSSGAAPTTTDLAAGRWTVWRDTAGATTKIYYNNAGAIIASAAFA